MKSIEIDTYFDDKPAHVEISAPSGIGGEMYFIAVNKSHQGSIIKTENYGRVRGN